MPPQLRGRGDGGCSERRRQVQHRPRGGWPGPHAARRRSRSHALPPKPPPAETVRTAHGGSALGHSHAHGPTGGLRPGREPSAGGGRAACHGIEREDTPSLALARSRLSASKASTDPRLPPPQGTRGGFAAAWWPSGLRGRSPGQHPEPHSVHVCGIAGCPSRPWGSLSLPGPRTR